MTRTITVTVMMTSKTWVTITTMMTIITMMASMMTTTIKTRSTTCVTFQQLIDRYLKPLVLDEIEQEKAKEELLELRNRMSIGFLFLNAVFVVTLYCLQLNTGTLYITWPCLDNDGKIIKLDPLGFTFLMMFGVMMVVQITGMILHRTSTFLHIMSTTILSSAAATELDKENTQNMIQLARHLGNLTAEENSSLGSSSTGGSMRGRRQWLSASSRASGATVNAEFERRLNELLRNLADEDVDGDHLARSIMARRGIMGRRSRRQVQKALRSLALRNRTQNILQPRSLNRDGEDTVNSLRGVRFTRDKDETRMSNGHHPTTSTIHHSTIPDARESAQHNELRPSTSNARHQVYENPGFTCPEPTEDNDSTTGV